VKPPPRSYHPDHPPTAPERIIGRSG
jgi:hypothetical protein